VAPLLVQYFGKGRPAYSLTALLMAALSLGAMVLCVIATGKARATTRTIVRVPMREQLRLALGNKPFAKLIFAKLLLLLAMSSSTTSMFYFATHVLQRNLSTVSQFGLLQTIGMLLSLPLWVRLGKRWSKHHLFMICCGLNSVLFLSWLAATPSEPALLLLLRSFLIGCTSGGALLMGQSLLPDTMEYDYRRTGMRREGAFSGAYSMVEKAGFAVGPLIIGLLLSNAGYGAKSGAPAAGATAFAVYMGVAVIPAVASALAVFVFRGFGLTESTLREMASASGSPAPHS